MAVRDADIDTAATGPVGPSLGAQFWLAVAWLALVIAAAVSADVLPIPSST